MDLCWPHYRLYRQLSVYEQATLEGLTVPTCYQALAQQSYLFRLATSSTPTSTDSHLLVNTHSHYLVLFRLGSMIRNISTVSPTYLIKCLPIDSVINIKALISSSGPEKQSIVSPFFQHQIDLRFKYFFFVCCLVLTRHRRHASRWTPSTRPTWTPGRGYVSKLNPNYSKLSDITEILCFFFFKLYIFWRIEC